MHLQTQITQLLVDLRSGNRDAWDRLLPLVHGELRRLARAQRRRWDGDETLNTTALVHEAYLRLVDQSSPEWRDRAHFLAVASRAMRQILIDHARRRKAQKRGGPWKRLSLEDFEFALMHSDDPSDAGDELLLALEESLSRLQQHSELQSRIVECRFFGGMTIPDTAAALGVSPSTVTRGWAGAQAWLYSDLRRAFGTAP